MAEPSSELIQEVDTKTGSTKLEASVSSVPKKHLTNDGSSLSTEPPLHCQGENSVEGSNISSGDLVDVKHPYIGKMVRINKGRFQGLTGRVWKIKSRGWWLIDHPQLTGRKVHSRQCEFVDKIKDEELNEYYLKLQRTMRRNSNDNASQSSKAPKPLVSSPKASSCGHDEVQNLTKSGGSGGGSPTKESFKTEENTAVFSEMISIKASPHSIACEREENVLQTDNEKLTATGLQTQNNPTDLDDGVIKVSSLFNNRYRKTPMARSIRVQIEDQVIPVESVSKSTSRRTDNVENPTLLQKFHQEKEVPVDLFDRKNGIIFNNNNITSKEDVADILCNNAQYEPLLSQSVGESVLVAKYGCFKQGRSSSRVRISGTVNSQLCRRYAKGQS